MDVDHRAVFLIAASSIDPIHPTVAQVLARTLVLPPPRFTTPHHRIARHDEGGAGRSRRPLRVVMM
jgi:hypothetical protein